MKQFWFENDTYHLMGVLRSPLGKSTCAVLFLHGFGQTKAGSYFLFSRMAQQLSTFATTMQFDFRGFGDSTGETEEVVMKNLISDARAALEELKRHSNCTDIFLVGSGFGNWVGLQLLLENEELNMIFLSPYSYKDVQAILPILNNVHSKKLDTFDLGDWDDHNILNFFTRVGEGLNRSRGIKVQTQFLRELANTDIKNSLKLHDSPILVFQSEQDIPVNLQNNITAYFVRNSDHRLMNPKDRDEIIDTTMTWIRKRTEDKN
jgi:pimeloyl-ACP methyl ester carboxylesterase